MCVLFCRVDLVLSLSLFCFVKFHGVVANYYYYVSLGA